MSCPNCEFLLQQIAFIKDHFNKIGLPSSTNELERDHKRLLIAIKALEKIAHPHTNRNELAEIAEDALASLLHVDER